MPKLVTKTAWQPIRATDLRLTGAEPGTCERCGRRDLRFLHVVKHPNGGQLTVGCECAKRLCYGYDPERAENRLRNLYARRSRWLTRNWATSRKGNETLKFNHEGETVWVTIFADKRDPKLFCCSISVDGGKPFFPSGNFVSADVAKLAAFDQLAETCEW